MNRLISLFGTLFLFAALSAGIVGQESTAPEIEDVTTPQAQAPTGGEAHELAKKLSNPVASLISVPFQSNFDFGMGSGSGWRYTLNFQPVIPVALNSKWNLISRTILPVIHQHNVAGAGDQSGLGDITQSFFFSPREAKKFVCVLFAYRFLPQVVHQLLRRIFKFEMRSSIVKMSAGSTRSQQTCLDRLLAHRAKCS